METNVNVDLIEKFKNREVKAKDIFEIREITKPEAYEFIRQYHYLKDAKFFAVYSYGLFMGEELVGCATYANPQGALSMKGWFGFSNDNQTIMELSRLCMLPILNGTNATSYLLGNSSRMLKEHGIRAVTTLADSNRHIGSIYQVCNFKYYGLTNKKTDFFMIDEKGKLLINARCETKDKHGVWLPRTRKHRYCLKLDRTLKILYNEQPHPTTKGVIANECCYGNHLTYDYRYDEWWTCPKCCGVLELVDNVKVIVYDDSVSTEEIHEKYGDKLYLIHVDIIKENEQILRQNKFTPILSETNMSLVKRYKQNIENN